MNEKQHHKKTTNFQACTANPAALCPVTAQERCQRLETGCYKSVFEKLFDQPLEILEPVFAGRTRDHLSG